MCILDILDNFPRLRISDSLMKVFLWALRECGAHDVPSFYHLRKVQDSLRATGSVPTRRFQSVLGNVFYMNDISRLIGKVGGICSTRLCYCLLLYSHSAILLRVDTYISIQRLMLVQCLRFGMEKNGVHGCHLNTLLQCSSILFMPTISMLANWPCWMIKHLLFRFGGLWSRKCCVERFMNFVKQELIKCVSISDMGIHLRLTIMYTAWLCCGHIKEKICCCNIILLASSCHYRTQ